MIIPILTVLCILSIYRGRTPNDRPEKASLSRVSYALFCMLWFYEALRITFHYTATHDIRHLYAGIALLTIALTMIIWEACHYFPKSEKPKA